MLSLSVTPAGMSALHTLIEDYGGNLVLAGLTTTDVYDVHRKTVIPLILQLLMWLKFLYFFISSLFFR